MWIEEEAAILERIGVKVHRGLQQSSVNRGAPAALWAPAA